MTTCEQCGADTVDEQGHCHTCGWHASQASGTALYEGDATDDADGSPSLGETRAAEVADAPSNPAQPRYSTTPAPAHERTTDAPRYTAARTSEPHPGTRQRASATATGQFCGTCGARIAPGEMYCGQCGSPVGQLTGTATGRVGIPTTLGSSAAGWSGAEGDAPTEAFVATQQGYSRPGAATPFPQGRYSHSSGSQVAIDGSARTMRIIFGLLCLVGSLVSAGAAVIVALQGK